MNFHFSAEPLLFRKLLKTPRINTLSIFWSLFIWLLQKHKETSQGQVQENLALKEQLEELLKEKSALRDQLEDFMTEKSDLSQKITELVKAKDDLAKQNIELDAKLKTSPSSPIKAKSDQTQLQLANAEINALRKGLQNERRDFERAKNEMLAEIQSMQMAHSADVRLCFHLFIKGRENNLTSL